MGPHETPYEFGFFEVHILCGFHLVLKRANLVSQVCDPLRQRSVLHLSRLHPSGLFL